MYFFPSLEPVCCSMSSSNCCLLTCIQISQESGQVVWHFHLLKNFPQFVVIHTVKGFAIVNKAEVDIFLELSCFFSDPVDIGNLISGSSAFDWTTTNWKIFKEIGIADHLTCLLGNLYAGKAAAVRTGHGTTDWFQIGNEVHQG